jgi:hypothetical protein
MFKRKKEHAEEQMFPSEADPATESAPAETDDLRTTCYPQDDGGTPTIAGHSRTTVYRQSLPYSRRTYDTIN